MLILITGPDNFSNKYNPRQKITFLFIGEGGSQWNEKQIALRDLPRRIYSFVPSWCPSASLSLEGGPTWEWGGSPPHAPLLDQP